MGNIPYHAPEVKVRVRVVLQEEGHLQGAVRLVTEAQVLRCQPHRQMEETGLREPVLYQVHPRLREQQRRDLYLSCSKGHAGEEREHQVQRVRKLWLQRMCQ